MLWKDSGNNLVLIIYDVSQGDSNKILDVTVVEDFRGARAAEVAYSDGFLIAAGGTICKVYLDDHTHYNSLVSAL